jgi:class 3 adenylate cyclase
MGNKCPRRGKIAVHAMTGMHFEIPGMTEANPPLKQLNRTFIGSVLFIDIVGYSRCTVPDQLTMKELFNDMLAATVQNVAPSDRIMVDTGDGAGIAFLGDPEDALFAALSLRDAIDAWEIAVGEPGFVRMGINLGPLKVVRDINGHTNMIGDGVNDAQRVMSFAEPGQVMVSHSYYDIISRFSRDYAQLFIYEGTRHDKHVREHEVYRFGPVGDNQGLAEKLRDRSRARQPADADPQPAAKVASPMPPAPKPVKAVRPAQKKTIAKAGMIAASFGAVSIVAALWSWTGTPETTPLSPGPFAPTPAEDKSAAGARPVADAAQKPRPPVVTAKEPPAALPTAEKSRTSAEAAPAPKPGIVRLAVQPWGEVYVNGKQRGVSPPIKTLTLAPGKHQIEIRNGDFAPHHESVEVKSGAETTVRYMF